MDPKVGQAIYRAVEKEPFARALNMELVETNASDYRTAEAIKHFAGLASQYATLFNRKRLIMLDEIDGISGKEDRGGVKELVKILKTTQNPIVLTANDAYNPRLRTIRKYCLVIPFKNPTVRQVISHLKRITKKDKHLNINLVIIEEILRDQKEKV